MNNGVEVDFFSGRNSYNWEFSDILAITKFIISQVLVDIQNLAESSEYIMTHVLLLLTKAPDCTQMRRIKERR